MRAQEARRILEAEERKGVDPGLVEQVKGNVYRTRIYPIPAKGTRTVQITYVSDLTVEDNDAAYHLPLAHATEIDEVSLHLEVLQAPVEQVGAAIEQHNDEQGIIWPAAIAPFEVALCPIRMDKSEQVREITERLYDELMAAGIDVLLDDRGLRPGAMFADIELIGIPHRIVIGDRALDAGNVEYRARAASDNEMVPLDGIVEKITTTLKDSIA